MPSLKDDRFYALAIGSAVLIFALAGFVSTDVVATAASTVADNVTDEVADEPAAGAPEGMEDEDSTEESAADPAEGASGESAEGSANDSTGGSSAATEDADDAIEDADDASDDADKDADDDASDDAPKDADDATEDTDDDAASRQRKVAKSGNGGRARALPARARVPVVFSTGSSKPIQTSATRMTKIMNRFRACPGRIVLTGHSDSTGGTSENKALSERRATAVRDVVASYLDDADIPVEVRGAGSTRPATRSDTPKARRLNRRVMIACEAD